MGFLNKFRSSFESYDFPKHQKKNWTPNHHGFFALPSLEGHLKPKNDSNLILTPKKKDLSSKPTHQLQLAFRGVKKRGYAGYGRFNGQTVDLRKWRENPTEILGWFLMERNAWRIGLSKPSFWKKWPAFHQQMPITFFWNLYINTNCSKCPQTPPIDSKTFAPLQAN